jgi:CHAT domain-containing protein
MSRAIILTGVLLYCQILLYAQSDWAAISRAIELAQYTNATLLLEKTRAHIQSIPVLQYQWHLYHARLAFEQNEVPKALASLAETEQLTGITKDINTRLRSESLFLKGRCKIATGLYSEALQCFDESLEWLKRSVQWTEIEMNHIQVQRASCYCFLGDRQLGIRMLEHAIKVYQQNGLTQITAYANALHVLGACSMDAGQLNASENYLHQALQLRKKLLPEDHPRIAQSAYVLAVCLNAQEQFSQAIHYFDIALHIHQKKFKHITPLYINLHAHKSQAYQALGQWESAEKVLEAALSILRSHPIDHLDVRILGNVHIQQAQILAQQKKYDFSLRVLDNGMQQLNKLFKPKPEEQKHLLNVFLALLQHKAIIYTQINSTDALQQAVLTCESGIRMMQSLSQSMSDPKSRQTQHSKFFSLFNTGISAAFTLYQQNGNPRWMEKAFYFSEHAQAQWLLTSLHQKNWDQQATQGIRELYLQLAQVERQHQSAPNTAQRLRLEKEILSTQELISKKLKALSASEFPEVISWDAWNKSLPPNTLCLKLFAGEKFIYLFSMHASQKQWIRVDKERICSQLDSLRAMTAAEANTALPGNMRMRAWTQASRELYQLIFEKFPKPLPVTSNLLLLSDGLLADLPWSALLYENAAARTAPAHMPWLFRKYQIHQQFSASVYQLGQRLSEKGAEVSWLGVAPRWIDLPAAQHQMQLLQTYTHGTLISGAMANLAVFKSLAPSYGVLHIAAHASYGQDEHQSGIYFPPILPDTTGQWLNLTDLAALPLKTELVVLDACATAMGEQRPGESVASMTYGFTQAGAKQILATLWPVSDGASSKIQQYFYQYLKLGYSTAAALQLAQQAYLSHAPDHLADPLYWGAYTLYGQPQKIYFNQEGNASWYWGAGLYLLLLGGFCWLGTRGWFS